MYTIYRNGSFWSCDFRHTTYTARTPDALISMLDEAAARFE